MSPLHLNGPDQPKELSTIRVGSLSEHSLLPMCLRPLRMLYWYITDCRLNTGIHSPALENRTPRPRSSRPGVRERGSCWFTGGIFHVCPHMAEMVSLLCGRSGHLPGALAASTTTLEVSISTQDSNIESRTHWSDFYFAGLCTCCGITVPYIICLLSCNSLIIGQGMVAQSCNPGTGETVVGRFMWVWSQLDLHSDF